MYAYMPAGQDCPPLKEDGLGIGRVSLCVRSSVQLLDAIPHIYVNIRYGLGIKMLTLFIMIDITDMLTGIKSINMSSLQCV